MIRANGSLAYFSPGSHTHGHIASDENRAQASRKGGPAAHVQKRHFAYFGGVGSTNIRAMMPSAISPASSQMN
jgi:hypothetical protein